MAVSRLALRIYLVGLAQMAVVVVGFLALVELARRARESPEEAATRVTSAVAALVATTAEREVVQRELERFDGAFISVVDPEGEVIATTAPADAPPCGPPPRRPPGAPPLRGPPPFGPPPLGGPPPPGPPLCRTAPLRFPDGRVGEIELRPAREPPGPPFGLPVLGLMLVVVGISSWLLARSLARPLRQLSSTARALGRGDLDARAQIRRSDELGEVATAFDEMADRVKDLLRAEKELIANVSHELRTPLARIRVALDLAAEGDAEVAREALADIAEDLDELERLVSDVLAAARLELADGPSGGVPPLRREALDMAALLAKAASRFQSAHPRTPLVIRIAGRLPQVEGDRVLVRRVVDNLLDNARKYGKSPDDPVELSAEAGDDELIIAVRDRGIGIAESELADVFRPFFRADRSRNKKTAGLGLGLALAKRIVDAHGGTIALESTPEEGTIARVRLPIYGGGAP